MTETKQSTSSQTLSRGLTALEVLAEADKPLTIGELSERLQLHRSITYRIVRTLEDHRFLVRSPTGELELGARLAGLARNVARDLQSAALPVLTLIANELGMTAFVVTLDSGTNEAVTLASVEPRHADAAVAQRPGNRHSVDHGAPGRAPTASQGPRARSWRHNDGTSRPSLARGRPRHWWTLGRRSTSNLTRCG